jgi:hypothetical protein
MGGIYKDLKYVGLKPGAGTIMDMGLVEVTEKIRELLRLHPEGLSITSISSHSG